MRKRYLAVLGLASTLLACRSNPAPVTPNIDPDFPMAGAIASSHIPVPPPALIFKNATAQTVWPSVTDQCWVETSPPYPLGPGQTGIPFSVQFNTSQCNPNDPPLPVWAVVYSHESGFKPDTIMDGCSVTVTYSPSAAEPYSVSDSANSELTCGVEVDHDIYRVTISQQ